MRLNGRERKRVTVSRYGDCKETGKQEMIEIEIERVKRRVYSIAIFNQRYTGIYRKQEVLKRNNKKLE